MRSAKARRVEMRQARSQFCRTAHRELAECQVRLLVYHLVPQKHTRSLLLAVSSSTINNPSEYIILRSPLFCHHRVFVNTLQNSLNCQRDQDQIQDSAMVGTNCRLQNSQPAGYLELDLSVLRQIRCPLRNNLLQGQRSLQAPLLVTQLVRSASRKRRNTGQEVKYHCSKDTPFSLSVDLFSFDDSIINYRYSSAFIPRAKFPSKAKQRNIRADVRKATPVSWQRSSSDLEGTGARMLSGNNYLPHQV